MKNILLLVHDDAGQEARLQTALDLTRAFNGHLKCVDIVQMPAVIGDYYNEAGEAMLLADERNREASNREALEARLAHEDIAWDWVDLVGDIADCVIAAAGLADLIVINRKLDSPAGPDMQGIAGAIATHVRKPLVAISEDCPRFDVTGPALIAWDGSPPVMATMRACTPLLALAANVHLLTIGDESEGVSAEEAAAYLSRHDIPATIQRIEQRETPIHVHIQEECSGQGASYCLMGAFGHSRVTEALFGGVTQQMLKTSRIPLVLGH
ncbi:universal stress protein UspA [Sphingomonas oleivorans]|uniref:Universal stress protein UspA n=1 Tax=Sphingomonas oleivorans TaxID=1735121 RepID=A0A2T5G0G8_9SPHN|nr:universal stress protein [Sphingomonas oleivorans]PTQ12655.1 universal stress protein UspA [Sphingomonas oleivorans]